MLRGADGMVDDLGQAPLYLDGIPISVPHGPGMSISIGFDIPPSCDTEIGSA